MITFKYGPTLEDGSFCPEFVTECNGEKWTGQVNGHEVTVYSEREGFTESDMDMDEVVGLAQRRCARSQAIKGGIWDWEIIDE